MDDLTLVIADRNYSSWSLRPWLALKMAGATFAEETVRLRRPDTKAEIARRSPTGKVPVLRHGAVTVWESLAICEYVDELFPAAHLWPEDRTARAVARAAANEMHAGFAPLRQNMPMDLRNRHPGQGMTPDVADNVARIQAIWTDCRARFGGGGPFLFGGFTIADAMYAPVTTRFVTYGVALDAVSAAYVDAVTGLAPMREWAAGAAAEKN